MTKHLMLIFICLLASVNLHGQSKITIEITSSSEMRMSGVLLFEGKKGLFIEEFSSQLAKDLNNSDWLDIKDIIFKETTAIQSEIDMVFAKYNARVLIVCRIKDKMEIAVYDTFDRSFLFEFRKDIGKSPIVLAHAVCDEIIYRLTGKPGIASSKILYVNQKNDTYNIMMADYDGSNAISILSANYIINYPRWFPGMKKIVFLSYRNTFPSLELLDLKTGQIETFIAEPGLNACISFFTDQDAAAVVLSRSGNPDLYIVNLKGNIIRRITEKKGLNASPSVSPDGKSIAFVSDRDGKTRLWVMDPYGLNTRKPDIPSNYITSPCWSPDGRYLAYAVRYGREMFIEVYDWKTGERRILTKNISWSDAPAWAPDSRHILFTRQEKYIKSLWVVDMISLRMKKITDNSWSGCWAIR